MAIPIALNGFNVLGRWVTPISFDGSFYQPIFYVQQKKKKKKLKKIYRLEV